jgi:hypothetical protein
MYTFTRPCPACGAPMRVLVDCSCGPPQEQGAECPACGACPVWRVDWCYFVELLEVLRDEATPAPVAAEAI